MVKKFTYSCDFAGKKYPVTFYIGNAAKGEHPIAFQSNWLSKEKGGIVPKDLMESLEKLKEISDNSKVPFEELCEYVIQEINLSNPSNKKAIIEAKSKKSNLKNNE
jgi:hypothetical protein